MLQPGASAVPRRPWTGFRNQSLFPKILLTFLIVIAPLYAMSMLMNRQGEQAVKNEISGSIESRVAYYMNTLENEISRIVKLQRNQLVDKELQRFGFAAATLTKFEWAQTALRIQDKLQTLMDSSLYIQNTSVHIAPLNRTLSAISGLGKTIAPEFAALGEAQLRAGGPSLVYWDNRLFVRTSYPTQTAAREPAFVVEAELSVAQLRQALSQFTNYEQGGAVLYDPRQGWSVASAQNPSVAADIAAYADKMFDGAASGGGIRSAVIAGTAYLLSVRESALLDARLLVFVPEAEVLAQTDTYKNGIWTLSILSLIIVVAFSQWIFSRIHKPLNKLVRSFRKVEDGSLEPAALPKSHDEFHHLFRHFNAMLHQVKVLIHEVYEQKIRAQSAELKQLQSQINPHFLYNTCFHLNRAAAINDNDNVLRLSRFLGEYFRFIARGGADRVTLEAEYNHTISYAEIQGMRFSNRFATRFQELPESCRLLPVPRLIMQPIVENAVAYGIEGRRFGGEIRISFAWSAPDLRIVVENSGDGMDEAALAKLRRHIHAAEAEETTGLRNVHRRLQLMYGDNSGIELSASELGGLRVALVLRFHPAGDGKGENIDVQTADRG